MKKYGFLVTSLALALALMVGVKLYEAKRAVDVFSMAKLKQEVILGQGEQVVFNKATGWHLDTNTVHILQDKMKGDKTEALEQLVERTLTQMHHKSWLDEANLQTNYIFGNIYKDANEELVLAVNRGKDLAMLFVFTETQDGFSLVTRLRGLAPIASLGVVGIPGFPYKGLILEEYLDEMTGGFFEANTKSVYLYKEGRLNKVFERIKYLKEYYPQGGQLKGDQTQWWMNTEEVDISFTDKGLIQVKGRKKEEKAQNLGDMAGPYELVFEREIEERYLWSPKELQFKLLE